MRFRFTNCRTFGGGELGQWVLGISLHFDNGEALYPPYGNAPAGDGCLWLRIDLFYRTFEVAISFGANPRFASAWEDEA